MLETYKKKFLKSLSDADQKKHKSIVEGLCADISDQDSEYFDAPLFQDMLATQLDLAKGRKKKEVKVSINDVKIEDVNRYKTVIDIVCDDAAFLVDSIAATVNAHKFTVELLVHPLVAVTYDENSDAAITSSADINDDDVQRQSHIHVRIHDLLSSEAKVKLKDAIIEAVEHVDVATSDWKTMLVRLKETSAFLEVCKTERPESVVHEYCEFLDYLHNHNFTLLGFAEYEFDQKGGFEKTAGLGLLAGAYGEAKVDEASEYFPLNLNSVSGALPPMTVSKTHAVTLVHRRVPMDIVVIKRYDDKGNVVGERLFLGLFTSVTYSRSVQDIPYLRLKISNIMKKSGFVKGSHDYKALRHILEKYPRDELFQTATETLHEITSRILRLQERQRIALFAREDVFGSYISCMVYVPRERYGTALRKQIVKRLEEELDGQCGVFFTSMDDSVFARGLFRIHVKSDSKKKFDYSAIEEKLQELGRTWAERLSFAFEHDDGFSEKDLAGLTCKYGDAFPVNYTNSHQAKQALFDISKIEAAINSNDTQLDLYRNDKIAANQFRLKVYNPARPIVLSDVMPILDDMGLRAIAELPYEITPEGADQSIWIHDFLLELPEGSSAIKLVDVKEQFEEAFARIWSNEMESDKLNRLVLSAGLTWRNVVVLRAYMKYMRQTGVSYSQNYIQETLTLYSDIAKDLVDLFTVRFDPSSKKAIDSATKTIVNSIDVKLQSVDSLNKDRVIRALLNIVLATLRTNFYQKGDNNNYKDYVSLKFDCRAIDVLPDPKPFREIFVYSTQVEGVHLRGDKIARGGLRWSDRHEDFRTEVLGLMKAQMVKNSVIVPMGSKGGFVVKKKTNTRDEFREAGVECYKTFISGLLDITDNLNGTKVIPPKDTVRHDEDDTYLVVAADKGTATFSDIANGISQKYGFWLDDAFASGGSAGYDHKKMGITARGAWESVKLHFRQLNHDTQTQAFDVIGVGDMGGDVFGNGMLLSQHIRLIGAFNHLHIFCDPNPDPAVTYAERKRLFEDVSGWDKYNQDLLSKGGRIYSRSDKSLELTPEIMERFGITEKNVPPEALLQAMLRAKTDLLWFGGIGTYIKSSKETHVEVGDKANDNIRIDAKDLKARVIGEGANLGTTHLGRIEFSKYGGRVNADFIDNSGGVDSSDHEVNIKILMSAVMQDKKSDMDLAARNKLLETMTTNIEDHVLRHNYQQALAVSLVEAQAADKIQIHEEFIQHLEAEEGLDRALEFLPDSEEMQRRAAEKFGLTRPELCVLISYAKISLTKSLLETDLLDDPMMQVWLYDYFPEQLRKTYKDYINTHKLRREIIAMAIANSLINRLGPTYIQATMKKTGMSSDAIVRSYIAAREIFELRGLWDDIEALDNKTSAASQLNAMVDVARLLEYTITWFLTRRRNALDVRANIDDYREPCKALNSNLKGLLSGDLKQRVSDNIDMYVQSGLPKPIAARVSSFAVSKATMDITTISERSGVDIERVATLFFAIGERFHIDWLLAQASEKEISDMWDREATAAVIDKIHKCQAGLTESIFKAAQDNGSKKGCEFDSWLVDHGDVIGQIDPLFKNLRRAGQLDLAMLMVAEQRLRHLYGG